MLLRLIRTRSWRDRKVSARSSLTKPFPVSPTGCLLLDLRKSNGDGSSSRSKSRQTKSQSWLTTRFGKIQTSFMPGEIVFTQKKRKTHLMEFCSPRKLNFFKIFPMKLKSPRIMHDQHLLKLDLVQVSFSLKLIKISMCSSVLNSASQWLTSPWKFIQSSMILIPMWNYYKAMPWNSTKWLKINSMNSRMNSGKKIHSNSHACAWTPSASCQNASDKSASSKCSTARVQEVDSLSVAGIRSL